MKFKRFLGIIGALLLLSSATHAETCIDAITKIKKDFSNQTYASVQSLLGNPTETKSVNFTLYQWPNYLLRIGDNGSAEALGDIGTTNKKINKTSYQEVSQLLGQPTSKTSEKWTEVTWRCPDEETFITLLVDNKNELFSGKSCLSAGAGASCSSFSHSKMSWSNKGEEMTREVKVQVQELAKNKLSEDIKTYNSHFNTSVQDKNQLIAQVNKRLQAYYANLRNCTPGTNQYAQPMFFSEMIFTVSVIEGMKNSLCVVDTSYDMSPQGKVLIKCKYKPESLALYTDEAATSRAHGNISFNSQNLTPIQNAESTQCQFYLDSKPIPALGGI